MLLVRVALDVANRVGVSEVSLFGVNGCGIPECELAETVGGTILEDVDDTAGTHVLTAFTEVAAIRHLGVESEGKVLAELGIQLGVDVGAAHTCVKDDTLILTLGDRHVETHIFCTTTD